MYKRWLSGLITAGVTADQIDSAMLKVEQSTETHPPCLAKFQAWCLPCILPEIRDAYIEACTHSTLPGHNHQWSHIVTLETTRRCNHLRLASEDERTALPRFTAEFKKVRDEFLAGKQFEQLQLEHKTAEPKEYDKEIGFAAMADINNGLTKAKVTNMFRFIKTSGATIKNISDLCGLEESKAKVALESLVSDGFLTIKDNKYYNNGVVI